MESDSSSDDIQGTRIGRDPLGNPVWQCPWDTGAKKHRSFPKVPQPSRARPGRGPRGADIALLPKMHLGYPWWYGRGL